MTKILSVKRIFTFAALCLSALLINSCGCDSEKSECEYNADCNLAAGETCQRGKCVPETSLSSDPDSATGSFIGTDVVIDSGTTDDSASTPDIDTTDSADSGGDTADDSASASECVSNAECDDGNPCTANICNTSTFPAQCEAKPRTDGIQCGDGNPCLGRATCQSGECVAGNPPCALESYVSECNQYEVTCDPDAETMCAYSKVPLNNNEPCNPGGDVCRIGSCVAGKCVVEGTTSPCDGKRNGCTSVACKLNSESEAGYTCEYSLAPDNQKCFLNSSESPCFATEQTPEYAMGYCAFNGETSDCVLGENRKCFDSTLPNMCQARTCVDESGECVDVPEEDVSILVSCGEGVNLLPSDFLTREYYFYAGYNCTPWDVSGMEVALKMDISEATWVTFDVTYDGGQTVSLQHLTDMCDPYTCQSNGTNRLTVADMTATDAVIVEAGPGYPPESIEISVTCEP